MVRRATSWPPCVRCGDPDGARMDSGTPRRFNAARFGLAGQVCQRCYSWLYAHRACAEYQAPLADNGDADYVADAAALVDEARRRFPVPWFTVWADAHLAGQYTIPEVIIEQARAVAFAALDAGNIPLAVAASLAEVVALEALAESKAQRPNLGRR